MRDISEILWKKYNLAIKALPSHDAQSIAGILATDVHGTGREYGFVNQSVLKLKLIDGRGEVFECSPGDDCFKAAIGGIGAIGIIAEVVLQCVDAFHIEQISKKCNKGYIKDNLNYLLEENDHVSIYAFPFTDKCVLSTWNRTDKEESFMGDIREFLNISLEALLLSSLVSFLTFIKLLPRTIDLLFLLKIDTKLVLKSYKGFNRTIYHLHNEFESALDRKEGMETVEEITKIYQTLYQKKNIPFNFLEIRFTPNHNNSLISPGHGRESVFIDLICNQSNGYKTFYSEAGNYLRTVDARPHLGKYCESFSKYDFERLYGDEFKKFKTLIEIHDPNNKFQNGLIADKFY